MSSHTCRRPAFHFAAPSGWLNDPNGLVYYDGQWHLFYQWNPSLTMKGNDMQWGHATSGDLVRWRHLSPALEPDRLGAIWSGSAVADVANTSGLFGAGGGLVAVFTHHGPDGAERQSLALSTDQGATWTRYDGNPVLGDDTCRNFRDPKVFWHEPTGRWVMVVGVKHQLFASPNLIEWTRLGETGFESECPDLFPLEIEGEGQARWCLSLGGRQYVLGEFDGTRFVPETEPLTVDGGMDFYAAQSWENVAGGRRVWIGWLNNWQYARDVPVFGARGFMTIPRDLSIRRTRDGLRLVQRPSRELTALRQGGITPDWVGGGTPGEQSVPSDVMEIEATVAAAARDTCGLRLRTSLGEETLIGYDAAAGCAFVDRQRSGRPITGGRHSIRLPVPNGPLKMHLFIDHTSVEAFFGDGAAVISCQIYPEEPISGAAWFSESGASRAASATIYPFANIDG